MHHLVFRTFCLSLLLASACGYNPPASRDEDDSGQAGSTGGQVNGTNHKDASVSQDGSLAREGGTTDTSDASPAGDARPALLDAPIKLDGATGGSGGSGGTTGPATGGAGVGGTTSTVGGTTGTTSPVGGTTVGGATSTGGTVVKVDAGSAPDAAVLDVPAVVTCPVLTPPLHGNVSTSSSNLGGVATFTCLPGYNPPNPATRTCQADGTWSGTNPSCVAVNCGAPSKPDHGSVEAANTDYESNATYACDPNYKLVGDSNRKCQASGTWSGTAPACQCAQTMCDGVCADLKTDNRHCGECNKSCVATSPSTAQCTPTGCLVTLATGVSLGDIAVDATSVYWADLNAGNAGSVNKVSKAGGATTTLASGENYPGGLAVDATNLYFASGNDEAVRKVPIAGGPVTTLATGENGPCCLAVNATDLYYRSTRGIVRLPLAGGTPSALPSTYAPGFALALNATHVYWRVDVTGGITAKLMKMPLDGSSEPITLTTTSSMGVIALDASNVYWTMPAGTIAGAGALAKMPLAGGTEPTSLLSGLSEPNGLVVDGAYLYFASRQDGTVMKLPVAGGTPTIIASQQRLPQDVAVDGTSVYWVNYGGSTTPTGSVMKLSPK